VGEGTGFKRVCGFIVRRLVFRVWMGVSTQRRKDAKDAKFFQYFLLCASASHVFL